MEDKKLFYKDILQRDITILRTASNTLEALKHRWPDKTQEMELLGKELVRISEVLLAEGWNGYEPKPIALVETEDGLTLLTPNEADQLAKEVEAKRLEKEKALAEKKRVADEKEAKIAKLKEDLKELEVE